MSESSTYARSHGLGTRDLDNALNLNISNAPILPQPRPTLQPPSLNFPMLYC